MPANVFSQKTLTAKFATQLTAAAARDEQIPKLRQEGRRKAIFAIHGISPHQRYAFQDQVALAFLSYLNAHEDVAKSGKRWKAVVHWPHLEPNADQSDTVRPSALRLYRADLDPADPNGVIYDVYEGYWSPLSKGKTNIASALKWLLNATFLGTSSTANIPCGWKKLLSDLGYVALLAAFMIVGVVLAGAGAVLGWTWYITALEPSTVKLQDLLTNPLATAVKLPLKGYLELAITVSAAYVLAQLFVVHKAASDRRKRTVELEKDANTGKSTFRETTINAGLFHRYMAVVLWAVFVVLSILAFAVPYAFGHFSAYYVWGAAIVTAAVLLFQYARSTADFAVESVLGDVQVYTDHDNNSSFYAVRQQIIQTVTRAFVAVLRAVREDDPETLFYDDVHVFAHSLGSTIGMDALIYVRQLVEEGALTNEHWQRIASFTTFGTALEKTRFFFDVRNPTVSAAQNQWSNDVYGRFFTDQSNVVPLPTNAMGIYWQNLWYFKDIVANEIVSYKSDVPAGSRFLYTSAPRTICDDHQLPHAKVPPWAWIHGDYLADENFWALVGPIVI